MPDQQTHLVTGAAGFIGSHLVDNLLSLGNRVAGVDNLLLGRRSNLAGALASSHFSFAELDVNDTATLADFLRGLKGGRQVDTVWHLAANSDIPAGVRQPEVDLRHTFLTTFHLLQVMEELGLRQLMFASSSAIYGELEGPLSEESGPLRPISNYGAMKLASEGVITAALERILERAWILRFPNVVGGRATHGAIYDFLKKLRANPSELEVLGDGSQEKPYLHVHELIGAMIFVQRHARDRLNVFNVAPEDSTSTVRFLAEATVRAAAPGARIRFTGGKKGWVGDVPRFRYSIEKIRSLGWQPRLTSNAAVELAIQENLVP